MHHRSVGQHGRILTLHGEGDATTQRSDTGSPRAQVEDTLGAILQNPAGVELTSSCTHALEAAATVLEVGEGDEVIVPAFSFPSTANPFLLRGARLRFADCDPATGNVTAESIERCSSPHTKAVVCMHYGGIGCDMEPIVSMCGESGWALVEDAAHGLFGSWSGRALGRFGTFSAFSFHRTKNISCHEGGALVVNDADLLDRVAVALDKGANRVAFERGEVGSYEWMGAGSAWRLAEPLVTLLGEQLERRGEIQTARRRFWDSYRSGLTDWAARTGTVLPTVPSESDHPAHLFWLLLAKPQHRGALVEHCSRAGIEVARHFGCLPASTFGATLADPADTCPVAERFADQLVRLPLHPGLSEHDVERVIETVVAFDF